MTDGAATPFTVVVEFSGAGTTTWTGILGDVAPVGAPGRDERARRGQGADGPVLNEASIAARSDRAARAVGGLGQKAHHHEVADPGSRQVRDSLRCHTARHEDGNTGSCAGQTDVGHARALPTGLGRRRLDRPGRDVDSRPRPPRPPGPTRSGWRGRRSPRGPRIRRASATGASSCPTWTPSAPASSARSGRSLSIEGHAVARHTSRPGAPGRAVAGPRAPCPAAGRRPRPPAMQAARKSARSGRSGVQR